MKIQQLINKYPQIKENLQAIKKLEQISNNYPSLGIELLTKWAEMSNPEEWEDTINDPDFSWTEYQQELTEQLLELSKEYPLYQNILTNFTQDLKLVESQGEWADFYDQAE